MFAIARLNHACGSGAATKTRLKADWTRREDLLTIDLRPFFERAIERFEWMDSARAAVTISEDIMGGTAVISGTRMPVYHVAAARAWGRYSGT